MGHTGIQTYVFLIVNRSEPGARRALFLKYSVMRSIVLEWKLHNVDQAGMIASRAGFSGRSPTANGTVLALTAAGYSASFNSRKPLSTMKKDEYGVFTEPQGRISDAQLKVIGDENTYTQPERDGGQAMRQAMVA